MRPPPLLESYRLPSTKRVLIALFAVFLASTAKVDLARGQTPPIRSRVNEVVLPVTVLNAKGAMVLNLSENSFHIFDNGEEQKIDGFDLGGDPLAIALVVETSSHVRPMAEAIRNMAIIFTETVMASQGQAALITYDSKIDLKQPFTQDHDAITRAMGNLSFTEADMRLYDAMAAAVRQLQQQPNVRRIMLVIGESQDRTSNAKLGDILRDTQRANITMYSVGLSSTAAELNGGGEANRVPLPRSLPPARTYQPPPDQVHGAYFDVLTPAVWLLSRTTNEIKNHQLEVASAATGGIHYGTLNSRTMQAALDKIGSELHAQYIISYAPSAANTLGFHQIRVVVDQPKLTVRTRPGYFAEASNTAPQ
jgi:VWFA-related protein